ncbi:hypothetical protein TheveDRAFT_0936 [Thermanaerovibrio velox DSM 12556]|uniref:Uncharacterized protein n=1 Tax=Thermanaerovibrio velox DSM 12556 TaxID=926567 RepID=H0URY3_9BACT|nr:hypothetical protein [Thermanaerovibrio velox]EHM10072.1 hypothetical protein TheveDRAFT_0936 [Thermanaerovibrio velox DSM 12556]
MRVFKILLCVSLLMLFSKYPSMGQEMPKADRRAAEALFVMAYRDLLSGRYWSALSNIQGALKKDTYMVDAYFLRSIIQRRMGDLKEAERSMRYYLEVRRTDYRGRALLKGMWQEEEALRNSLNPSASSVQVGLLDARGQGLFGRLDPLFLRGMGGAGKVSSMGDKVFFVDSLGDRVHVYANGRNVASLRFKSPSVVVPLDYLHWVVFCSNGESFRVEEGQYSKEISVRPFLKYSGRISDAAVIQDGVFLIGDQMNGRLAIVSIDGRILSTWHPPLKENKLPEIVAVDVMGKRFAVADRGRGLVYVLDWEYGSSFKEVASIRVPSVRDVIWNHEGGLFIVAEGGTLFKTGPVTYSSVTLEAMQRGLRDPWSICLYESGLILIDQGGRLPMWGVLRPGVPMIGLLGVRSMKIEEIDLYQLTMVAKLPPFLSSYLGRISPVSRGVWQNKLAMISVSSEGYFDDTPESLVLTSSTGGAKSVWEKIKLFAEKGSGLPEVLVVSSGVKLDDTALERLLAFCLINGIRLDLISDGASPSVKLDMARRLTGGYLYNGGALSIVPIKGVQWTFRMPLSKVDVPLGNVSDALVSIFVDAEAYSFRDWLPFWPGVFR